MRATQIAAGCRRSCSLREEGRQCRRLPMTGLACVPGGPGSQASGAPHPGCVRGGTGRRCSMAAASPAARSRSTRTGLTARVWRWAAPSRRAPWTRIDRAQAQRLAVRDQVWGFPRLRARILRQVRVPALGCRWQRSSAQGRARIGRPPLSRRLGRDELPADADLCASDAPGRSGHASAATARLIVLRSFAARVLASRVRGERQDECSEATGHRVGPRDRVGRGWTIVIRVRMTCLARAASATEPGSDASTHGRPAFSSRLG